jgi:hypothetical protein
MVCDGWAIGFTIQQHVVQFEIAAQDLEPEVVVAVVDVGSNPQ